MIVLSLTSCPHALRGDLTRWLFEVDTNLYVGKQSARIRDKIWERVTANTKSGRSVMVYPTNNEQGFDFRVCGATWEPVDYDGLKLMLRPHPGKLQANTDTQEKWSSKAEKRIISKRFANKKKKTFLLPDSYIVLDIETTGLSVETDEIIEIGSIKVEEKENVDTFQAIINTKKIISPEIENLTGISNKMVLAKGRDTNEVLNEFQKFTGEMPIISHNIAFDISFLRKAYEKYGYTMPTNPCIDTLRMARQLLDDLPDYKLGTLLEYLQIEHNDLHRGLEDCKAIKKIFEKFRLIYSSNC